MLWLLTPKANSIDMEALADVFEAVEDLDKYRPIYLALLKVCRNKEEAAETLRYIKAMGLL